MTQFTYLGVKDTDELVVGEGALALLRRVHARELRTTLLEHARLGIPTRQQPKAITLDDSENCSAKHASK